MGLRQAMAILADGWDDLANRLSGNDFAELARLAGEFAGAAVPAEAAEVAEEIADHLGDRLDEEHPLRRALAAPETRYASVDPAEWVDLAGALRIRLNPAEPTAAEVLRRATEWLLAAPAVSEAELREKGQDPGDGDLIRLDRADGTGQWPAFQFAADGSPLALVRAINQLLDAADDPWGVADWWLGHNGWLGGAPAR